MQNAISTSFPTSDLEHKSHRIDYAVLSFGSLVAVYALLFVAYNSQLRLIALGICILLYLLWGIMHHYRNCTLTKKILYEYLGFSFFLTSAIIFLATIALK